MTDLKKNIEQLIENKEFEQAIEKLLQLPNLESDFDALMHLSSTYKLLGQWGNAINYYQKALKLKPEDEFIKNEIALLQTYLNFEKLDIYASTNLNNDPWFE